MELGTGIGVAGGGISIASIVVSLLVWSLKRNVGNEDKWREGVEDSLTKFKDREGKRDIETSELRGELRGLAHVLGELRGSINQLAGSVEASREKQAAFYREELSKVERAMREEISRTYHPELPEKIVKLEAAIDALNTRRKR